MGVFDMFDPIKEVTEQLNKLRETAETKGIDLSREIRHLELKLDRLEKDIYGNMKPWDRVQLARNPKRPTTLDYIHHMFPDFMELHGDRHGYDDAAIVSGLATFEGVPVTIIGHQRGRNTKENMKRNFGMPHPEGYRKALRFMKQAEKFNRPILTFIDTKGAYPGKAAEERGQSEAIARNLFEMATLKVPIVSVVIGEGGSGGALGIGVCDRLLMLENSTYSVISPEGAAALLWKDAKQAERAAETMKITAQDLFNLGIVDEVAGEVYGGAHVDVSLQSSLLKPVLLQHMNELLDLSTSQLIQGRATKYHQIGTISE